MRHFIFSAIILIFFSTSMFCCSKTTNGKWVIYKETACLPFWTNEDNNRKTKNTLETFLKSEGIIPLKIKIVGEREYGCDFCNCPTGIEYRVQVDKSQVGQIAYWGFELK